MDYSASCSRRQNPRSQYVQKAYSHYSCLLRTTQHYIPDDRTLDHNMFKRLTTIIHVFYSQTVPVHNQLWSFSNLVPDLLTVYIRFLSCCYSSFTMWRTSVNIHFCSFSFRHSSFIVWQARYHVYRCFYKFNKNKKLLILLALWCKVISMKYGDSSDSTEGGDCRRWQYYIESGYKSK
jgi:hypothetical protein